MTFTRSRRPSEGPDERPPHGQSVAELAIVLPVLLFLVLIALDFGRVFFGWVQLNNAVRVAANYASLHPTADWASPTDPDRVRYEQLVRDETNALGCTLGSVSVPTFPSGTDLGQPAESSFSCAFDVITPFIGKIVGDPVTVSAAAVFPIRSGGLLGTTVPLPSPSESPAASPCTHAAPEYVSQKVNSAQGSWSSSGFTGSFTIVRPPSGNYTVGWQSLVAGQPYPCEASITVSKTAP